ncbi:hypothetical protein AAZX31_16G108200 [Glycine max]|uniref:Uncharacterized protein n=2 Tax=Glycine subgen. Soja TaxID=1462606 RepID=I1MMZ0_SOYBN|nr:GDSL esterase/lipase At5g37690-like [Glycine max]KAG5108408.1 hypothetical protein JHK84_045315 [Glycine max]KRH07949.1 hypothetical protein GLYMA_16G120300v4 [Glycine max]
MGVLILFVAIFVALVGSSLNVDTETAVPAVYIFGDSIFDVGTNNFLNDSKARADNKPYGIDFPNSKPTGRFSNGYNTADQIVRLLGLNESPPAYLYLVNNDTENFNSSILKGVNFASGGSGIMEETGKQHFIDVVSMADQIQQFATVHGNILQYLNDTAEATINKSLFLISAGSNDIFDFLLYNVSKNPNFNITREVQEFFNLLRTTYHTHLKNLHNLGARKFGILSVPPVGCVPIVTNGTGHCVNDINTLAALFHIEIGDVLENLSSEFPGMKYSLGNSYAITYDMINNPDPLHLSNVTSACCGNETVIDGVPCGSDTQVCENRSQFLFWDQYHPTEHASRIAAHKLYSGGKEYVAPMNFSLLVQE